MRWSHYFFNYTKMRQLIARENVKQFDIQNVKNGQQSNIFWFNWHNKLMLLRIICKKNILFNDKLKTIISLHFLYACHIYCKSHILHGDYSFIINALLWTFWLPRFMKVINHFQSVIDWLSSFQSGQARHKFNYIQIFYEYLTEIRISLTEIRTLNHAHFSIILQSVVKNHSRIYQFGCLIFWKVAI